MSSTHPLKRNIRKTVNLTQSFLIKSDHHKLKSKK